MFNRDQTVRLQRLLGASAFGVATLAATLLVGVPAADAQYYVAGYLGANHTMPATVTIDLPDDVPPITLLEFRDVRFAARPFTSPQYYGLRVGHLFGNERRWGVEFEWVHPKVYAEVDRPVHVTDRLHGSPVETTTRMDAYIQRYAMSHGMNFALVNVVWRKPLAATGGSALSRVALMGRAGAGPMVVHSETTVFGQSHEQYQRAGVGFQLAGGVDVRLAGWLSAVADYKFGHARPTIAFGPPPSATGQMSANVHQIAFGLAWGLSR